MHIFKVRFVFGALLTLSLFGLSTVGADDAKWIELFDGKTLDGWEKVGNQESVWEAKEGAIDALPAGYEVSENTKTGLPLLKKKK